MVALIIAGVVGSLFVFAHFMGIGFLINAAIAFIVFYVIIYTSASVLSRLKINETVVSFMLMGVLYLAWHVSPEFGADNGTEGFISGTILVGILFFVDGPHKSGPWWS